MDRGYKSTYMPCGFTPLNQNERTYWYNYYAMVDGIITFKRFTGVMLNCLYIGMGF